MMSPSQQATDAGRLRAPAWHTGFPGMDDYAGALASSEFTELAEFSGRFLATRSGELREYSGRWVSDPLHNWSRQWEYPFTLARLRTLVSPRSRASILDAGSGFTFFPYYLAQAFPGSRIWCADADRSLTRLHGARSAGKGVSFNVSSIQALPFRTGTFDVVYSISVLEHLADPAHAIDELARVIRPAGTLLLTFDVAPDGSRHLSPEQAQALLDSIAGRFELIGEGAGRMRDQLSQPGVLTTLEARRIDPRLLPWKFPPIVYQLRDLVQRGRLGQWPPVLTVYCIEARKR